MSRANEFRVEFCFLVQIVRKHGVLYVTSEYKKIACFAPSPPITTTAPMLDFLIFRGSKGSIHRGKSNAILPVNPPLAGGHITPPPLANFLNNLKMRAGIGAKLTVPYSESIWHPQTKFQRNPS